MSTVDEIEQAIRSLGPQELTALREWFAAFDAELRDRQLERDVAARCSFCAEPESALLDELAADGAKAVYLCRCPVCGQYWGGHGYTPQFRWRLSPEEAAQFFPDAFANESRA